MARLSKGLIAASEAPKPALIEEDPAVSAAKRRTGREGKGMLAAWADDAVCEEFRILAVRRKTTVQDLLLRGVDLVFREEGLPEIASSKREGIAA